MSKKLKCDKFLQVAREKSIKDLREYNYSENVREMRFCILMCYGPFIGWYIWMQIRGNFGTAAL